MFTASAALEDITVQSESAEPSPASPLTPARAHPAGHSMKSPQLITVDTMIRGAMEVPLSSVLTFVNPLLGFEHLRRFIIMQTSPGPLSWLQSVEDRRAAFCLIEPFAAGIEADMAIGPADAAAIGADSISEITVYTVVVLDADAALTRTNLAAPILVNHKAGLAMQTVLEDQRLPVRFYLKDRRAVPAQRAVSGQPAGKSVPAGMGHRPATAKPA